MITLIITLPDEKIKAFEEKSTFFSKKIYVFRIISVFFLPEAVTCTKNRFTPRWVQTGFFEALRLISCAFVLIRMCQINQVLCPNDNSQSICDDFQYSEDGTNWFSLTNEISFVPKLTDEGWKIFRFKKTVKARYIRVYVGRVTGYTSMNEAEIFAPAN